MIRLSKIVKEGEEPKKFSNEVKKHFLEIVSTYNKYQEMMDRKSDIAEIAEVLGGITEAARELAVNEQDNWFDAHTVKRNMSELTKLGSQFDKVAVEAKNLDQRLHGLYEDMGHILSRYYKIGEITEDQMKERLGIREDGKLQGGEKDPCWKGYEMIGMKPGKDGSQVPNCVPKNESIKESKDCGCNSVNEGKYDSDLDKVETAVKNATSFMNVGSELKKAGIKYDFSTSMMPMYMIKVSGNTIAIVNKKYAAGAERTVNDIAIGLLENKKFNKSLTEATHGYKDSTASYIDKHNDEYKAAEKMNKGNEQGFYDSLSALEEKLGHPKYMIFLSNALRGYKVDMYKDPKIKNQQEAEEALYLLSK
jgi:hypothetical protein